MTNKINVLGVKFDQISSQDFLDKISLILKSKTQSRIAFANPEFVVQAQCDNNLQKYLNSLDLNVADGFGILLGSKIIYSGKPNQINERITGTDFAYHIAQMCEERKLKLFILGGTAQINQKAQEKLLSLYPKLKLNGSHGFYGRFENYNENIVDLKSLYEAKTYANKQKTKKKLNKIIDSTDLGDWAEAVDKINEFKADVVMVCLGCPLQEYFIMNYGDKIKSRLIFGNGGAVDFLAGNVRRSPSWIQTIGFEWLWRLGQNLTIKRFKRQLHIPLFMWMCKLERLSKEVKKPR